MTVNADPPPDVRFIDPYLGAVPDLTLGGDFINRRPIRGPRLPRQPNIGTIRPLSRANCASSIADNEYSIAAHTSGSSPNNPIVKAFLGNGVSGVYNLLNNDSLGEAAKDIVFGGANQGVPGGKAINKGLVGVSTDLIIRSLGTNVPKAAVDVAGTIVGYAKLGYDAATYAYAYVFACR